MEDKKRGRGEQQILRPALAARFRVLKTLSSHPLEVPYLSSFPMQYGGGHNCHANEILIACKIAARLLWGCIW